MGKYVRLAKSKYDFGKLIPESKAYELIDSESDYYLSTYYYNDQHLDYFNKNGSVKGIRDVTTNKIWFDLDSKDNPEKARFETLEIISRLRKAGVKDKNIQVYFSGNKGYNVIVELNRNLTPDQVQSIVVNKFGKNLETLDLSLYDANQLLRVPGTKHEASGLYKIPLKIEDVESLTTPEIKKKASSLDNVDEDFEWDIETVSDDFIPPPVEAKPVVATPAPERPKHWKDYKWSLMQGDFNIGERHHAMMVLAATCRGLGYDEKLTEAMLLSADQKHCEKTGDKPVEDLQTNIIPSVFSTGWQGGQYSPESDPWLKKYCERMGFDTTKKSNHYQSVDEIFGIFKDYADNFEKNIVKTGIKGLDENVMFLTSTHNGVLGQPGAGKTSLMLQWLENCSMNDIPAVFYSLDMGAPIIYGKLFQKELGCDFKSAMRIMKDNPKLAMETHAKIKEKYKNVKMCFRSGVSPQDIKRDIQEHQELTGKKVKLLGVDYLECLQGPYSDSLANTGYISQQMKDIANEEQVCSVMLLQTQKHSTSDISDPLLSMKQIKGSSVIEQASSVVLTLWREGYSPRTVNDDRYMSFAAVKNRFGGLWSDDFAWEGKRGLITELTVEQRAYFEQFKEEKAERRKAEKEEEGRWV